MGDQVSLFTMAVNRASLSRGLLNTSKGTHFSRWSPLSKGSTGNGIINMLLGIFGSAVVAVPLTMARAGLLFGIILFAAGGLVAYVTNVYLINCHKYTHQVTYKELAEASCKNRSNGANAGAFVNGVLVLNRFGTMIAALVAMGGLLQSTAEEIYKSATGSTDASDCGPACGRTMLLCASTIGIILPLSLLPNLNALRFSSSLALACVFYLVISCTVLAFTMDGNGHKPESEVVMFNSDWQQIFLAFPLVIFGYTCHPNIGPIFKELREQTPHNFQTVIAVGVFFVFFLYSTLGSSVYLTFLEDTDPNFLLNDYQGSTVILVGRVGVCLTLLLGLPIVSHICRRYTLELAVYIAPTIQLSGDCTKEAGTERIRANSSKSPPRSPVDVEEGTQQYDECVAKSSDLSPRNQDDFASSQRNVATILLIACTLPPAVYLTNIATVVSFMGATTNSFLCFVLPAVFYVKICPEAKGWRLVAAASIAVVMTLGSLASLVVQMTV